MGLHFIKFRETKWPTLHYFTIFTPMCCKHDNLRWISKSNLKPRGQLPPKTYDGNAFIKLRKTIWPPWHNFSIFRLMCCIHDNSRTNSPNNLKLVRYVDSSHSGKAWDFIAPNSLKQNGFPSKKQLHWYINVPCNSLYSFKVSGMFVSTQVCFVIRL